MRILILILLSMNFMLFQNCGESVTFSNIPQKSTGNNLDVDDQNIDDDNTNPPPIIVCNPLDPSTIALCPNPDETDEGLVGNLYYLNENLASGIGKTLSQTIIDDYIDHGIRVNALLIFNQINITPRSWDLGFQSSAGATVMRDDGEALFEWFAVHLKGKLQLPAGDWQLAMISDDGMRVTLDGDMVLNDDSQHAPRVSCADTNIKTNGKKKQEIELKYFQGPRYQIAMQLVYRDASRAETVDCDDETEWLEVPASAFSH